MQIYVYSMIFQIPLLVHNMVQIDNGRFCFWNDIRSNTAIVVLWRLCRYKLIVWRRLLW